MCGEGDEQNHDAKGDGDEEVDMLYLFLDGGESFVLFQIGECSADFRKSEPCNEGNDEEEYEKEAFVDVRDAIPEFVVEPDDDDDGEGRDAQGLQECFSFDECEVHTDDE